ncbi:MAG TPA: aminoacyl-tRNA hydrolase [Xanthobacteraceae bacterium]|jgi:PTH1 family peptidyl-tRNA hydrolase|nr:aminoacyl-tRNA hydrolase [Xanthobacteraceae bacterium]
MLLFVGLGNPGRQYARNRHNIGFMAVEAIARRHRFSSWQADRKLESPVAEGPLDGTSVTLLKPWLYMNDSGVVVGAAKQFRKVALSDIVVFHDEVELPPGELRIRTGGGNAGHNGLRSITAHIGNDYRRVRMGIGHPGKNLVYDYALSDFGPDERAWVEALCDTIAENAGLLAAGDDENFQNKVYAEMDSKHLISLRPPPSWRTRTR